MFLAFVKVKSHITVKWQLIFSYGVCELSSKITAGNWCRRIAVRKLLDHGINMESSLKNAAKIGGCSLKYSLMPP